MKRTVAIVGRPNVGKSTLFNRLVGRRMALVHDQPGMTRDRKEGEASLFDLSFKLIDTAGLADPESSLLTQDMIRQTMKAVDEADAVLFVIDGREGCTPHDHDLARDLRKKRKPVIILANKCEGNKGQQGLLEAMALGLGDVIPVSAEHGEGMLDLYEKLKEYLDHEPSLDEDVSKDKPLQLAIVGRPNVGKSTLINRLIGEERLLTGDMPGVTRDSISVDWHYNGRPLRLVDTAGMRKQSKVLQEAERLSVMDTERTIQYAEVVVLVMDATTSLEKQDLHIAAHVIDEGRALVLVLNKWDLVQDKTAALKEVDRILGVQLTQGTGLPVITVSALEGRNLAQIFEAVFAQYDLWNRRLPTATLNRWLEIVTQQHPPPAVAGRRIRLKYMTQIKTRPPTFAIFATQMGELPDSYMRYLANQLRKDFDMPGVPLRLYLRASAKNPYDKKG